MESPVKVYNLEVEDYHTYFVGESSVLVHNGCEEEKITWNQFQQQNKGKYDQNGMSEAWNAYKMEHPDLYTKTVSEANADKLRRNMVNSGIQEPSYNNAAHHIVAGNAPDAEEARNILRGFGIGINDASNGVFLPTELGVSNAAYHPSLHTSNYFSKVNALMRNAENAEEAVAILSTIKEKLLNGTF